MFSRSARASISAPAAQDFSDLDRLLAVYDVAIAACVDHRSQGTARALDTLLRALDQERAPQIATGFLRLYHHCGELIRQNRFDEAARLLRELRNAWLFVKLQSEMGSRRSSPARHAA